MPDYIQDIIFDFANKQNEIKTYFKDNIAPYIDKTIKKIDNGCELCYIQQFKKNNKQYTTCLVHTSIKNNSKSKYFSLYNLPNGKYQKTIGKLFMIINDVEYFQKILLQTEAYENHRLSEINNEFNSLNIQ